MRSDIKMSPARPASRTGLSERSDPAVDEDKMTDKIRIAIAGYGNLGRGVDAAIDNRPAIHPARGDPQTAATRRARGAPPDPRWTAIRA